MVAGTAGKKIGQKILGKAAKSSVVRRAGAGAAAAATAEFLEDNPYVSAAEGAALGFAVAGPVGAAAGGLVGWFMADGERIAPCDLVAIPGLRNGAPPSRNGSVVSNLHQRRGINSPYTAYSSNGEHSSP